MPVRLCHHLQHPKVLAGQHAPQLEEAAVAARGVGAGQPGPDVPCGHSLNTSLPASALFAHWYQPAPKSAARFWPPRISRAMCTQTPMAFFWTTLSMRACFSIVAASAASSTLPGAAQDVCLLRWPARGLHLQSYRPAAGSAFAADILGFRVERMMATYGAWHT